MADSPAVKTVLLLRTLLSDTCESLFSLFPYLIPLYQTSQTFPQFSGSLEPVSLRKSISFTLQSRKRITHSRHVP